VRFCGGERGGGGGRKRGGKGKNGRGERGRKRNKGAGGGRVGEKGGPTPTGGGSHGGGPGNRVGGDGGGAFSFIFFNPRLFIGFLMGGGTRGPKGSTPRGGMLGGTGRGGLHLGIKQKTKKKNQKTGGGGGEKTRDLFWEGGPRAARGGRGGGTPFFSGSFARLFRLCKPLV